MLLIMAMKDGREQNVEAELPVVAAIFATGFIAEGYRVKIWDSVTKETKSLSPLSGPVASLLGPHSL